MTRKKIEFYVTKMDIGEQLGKYPEISFTGILNRSESISQTVNKITKLINEKKEMTFTISWDEK